MSETKREMTLAEVVAMFPPGHVAAVEYEALCAAARERRLDRLVELAKGALSGMIAAKVDATDDAIYRRAAVAARAVLAAIEAGEEGK